jgi:hypothetical protein
MGEAGLADRRLGPSLRRASVAEIERMLGLYRDLYRGFTVKHFHEQLGKRHNYTLGYTVTKLHLHRAGLVQAATKRSAHRKKRPRRPMVGMMLHHRAAIRRRQARQRRARRFDACLATGECGQARSRCHYGRRNECDLLGIPGGSGKHGIERAGRARRGGEARAVLLTLY